MEEIDIFKLTREEQAYNPLEVILKNEINKRIVSSLLSILKPREYYVIVRRFGLDGYEAQTLKAIGLEMSNLNTAKLGINGQAVRIIEARALRKLRIAIYRI